MADDNVETTAPIATEAPSEATKPDYVQDKFWNVNSKQVNIENLASSYNTLEKKLGTRTEDLSKQIRGDLEKERQSKVPESYKLNVPEIPQNIDLKVDKREFKADRNLLIYKMDVIMQDIAEIKQILKERK